MKLRLGVFAALALGFLVAGTGCATNKTNAERESLLSQNKELQQQLDAEKVARQNAESKAAAMNSQLTAPPAPSENVGTPGMGAPIDLSAGGGRISSSGGRNTTPVRTTTPTKAAVRSKVTIPGNVLFDSGKTTLSASATKTLDTIAATIKKQYAGAKIVIEGFTDNTPVKATSPLKSNEALATARATAVKNYLAKKGIASADMSVKGTTEAASTKNPALNRRVEVAVMVEK